MAIGLRTPAVADQQARMQRSQDAVNARRLAARTVCAGSEERSSMEILTSGHDTRGWQAAWQAFGQHLVTAKDGNQGGFHNQQQYWDGNIGGLAVPESRLHAMHDMGAVEFGL